MADEIFIALEQTSQEIKTAVTNMQGDVDAMQSDVSATNTTVNALKNTDIPIVDSLVDAVLERIGITSDSGGTSSLGTLMAKINAVLEKLDESSSSGGGEKWVYSGTTGTTKYLIRNEEWIEDQLDLPARTDNHDNEAFVVGFFVPKVSGLHTITITTDTLNASEDAILTFATFNELMHAVMHFNTMERDQITNFDYLYEQFEWVDGGKTSRGVQRGYVLLLDYMSSNRLASDETATIKYYCTKDEPVFLLAVNNESVDITLWSAVVTVEYNETEPYE